MANILNEIQKIYNKHYKECHYIIYSVILLIFFILVLNNPHFYEFNKDEIHAWNIATDLNIIETIKLMRAEGHGIIWYLMLKPFTLKPDLFFPWIIKWLNFMFIFAGLIIFWFKAPISILFKILITFSFPLFGCLAILGRCYGIGIFFLCLIALNYQNRLNKPILFSILLFITANTSLIASIAISGLSIVYTFELFKEKKLKNIIPLCILLLIPISLYCLWHNPVIPSYSKKPYYFELFEAHLFYASAYIRFMKPWIPYAVYFSGVIISILYFRYNEYLYISFILTYAIFILFTLNIYALFDYHYHFMFIMFCVFYWINSLNRKAKTTNIHIELCFNIWFVALCFILSPKIKNHNYWFTYNDLLTKSLNCVYDTIPQGSIIYTSMYSVGREIPYLRDRYILKTLEGENFHTFDTYFNTYNNNEKIDQKKLLSIHTESKQRYILMHSQFIKSKNLLPNTFIKNSKLCTYLYLYKLKK